MNQENMMEMYQETKKKLQNWPLMTCTEEEKTQWFKDTVVPIVARLTVNGDAVQELVVVDDLYDVAVAAMSEAPLPSDFPEQQHITRDQLERDFAEYCKNIMIRTATIEQLTLPGEDNVAPEMQFIRPVTSKMRAQGYIDHWDKSIGFSEGLKMMGVPFDFTYEEKKILFGFAQMMNTMAASAARQIQAPQANMFKP